MNRFVRSSTKRFLRKLDSKRKFYTPEYLLEIGFPDFLVKRIKLELQQNMESISPPKIEWVDMSTKKVEEAWSVFLKEVGDDVRLPAGYVTSVLETAIGEIIDSLATPRSFIPEYIFDTENELDLESIKFRSEWVVVYPYLATAISRFMEKKGRESIKKEQAVRIIERLDERVIETYSSSQWAKLFEPWFQILGEGLDPLLIAKFFKEKKNMLVAKEFEKEIAMVDRNRLVEIITRPQAQAQAQAGVKEAEKEVSKKEAVNEKKTLVAQSNMKAETKKEENKSVPESLSAAKSVDQADDRDDANLLNTFGKGVNGPLESDISLTSVPSGSRDDNEDVPIWQRFIGDSAGNDEEEEEEEPTLIPVENKDNESEEVEEVDEEVAEELEEEEKEEEEETTSVSEEDDSEPIKIPEPVKEEKDISELVPSAQSLLQIRTYVNDNESEYIDEIFGGDENLFLDTLQKISRFDDWKQAGTFIAREVFGKNKVDMFSDTSITFTDKMQTYFYEKKMD